MSEIEVQDHSFFIWSRESILYNIVRESLFLFFYLTIYKMPYGNRYSLRCYDI